MPTTTPDMAAIPESVLRDVAGCLAEYARRAAEVRRAGDLGLNPMVGGGRRYVDEVRPKFAVASARETLREFLAIARGEGIDGLAVLRSLAARHPGTDPLAGLRAKRT